MWCSPYWWATPSSRWPRSAYGWFWRLMISSWQEANRKKGKTRTAASAVGSHGSAVTTIAAILSGCSPDAFRHSHAEKVKECGHSNHLQRAGKDKISPAYNFAKKNQSRAMFLLTWTLSKLENFFCFAISFQGTHPKHSKLFTSKQRYLVYDNFFFYPFLNKKP